MKKFMIFVIRCYQNTFSQIVGKNCKFVPSCSHYAIGAIERYGAWKGFKLSVKRFFRCNPFSKGGYDPVPKNII